MAKDAAAQAASKAKETASSVKSAINQATLNVDISKLRERRAEGLANACRVCMPLCGALTLGGKSGGHGAPALRGVPQRAAQAAGGDEPARRAMARETHRRRCRSLSAPAPRARRRASRLRTGPPLAPQPRAARDPRGSNPAVQVNFLAQLVLTGVSWAVVFLTSHITMAQVHAPPRARGPRSAECALVQPIRPMSRAAPSARRRRGGAAGSNQRRDAAGTPHL